MIVQRPALRRLGIETWVAYSRHADLGPGLFVYPPAAIGGAALGIAAAILFHLHDGVPRSAGAPLHLGAALAASGLLLTMKAAPIMLGLRRADDPAAWQRAYAGFYFWSAPRAVVQVLAFAANLWALAALCL